MHGIVGFVTSCPGYGAIGFRVCAFVFGVWEPGQSASWEHYRSIRKVIGFGTGDLIWLSPLRSFFMNHTSCSAREGCTPKGPKQPIIRYSVL